MFHFGETGVKCLGAVPTIGLVPRGCDSFSGSLTGNTSLHINEVALPLSKRWHHESARNISDM